MRSTWFNRRAIGLHITAAVLIPTFLALGWWQLRRALGGNSLSWAYTFEWPIFAGYGTYMWWKIVHDIAPSNPHRSPVKAPATESAAAKRSRKRSDDDAKKLAAYNEYLASLHGETHDQTQS